MAEAQPTEQPPINDIEADVTAAITLCDGDVRAALAAALVYNKFLEQKLDKFRGMISTGYTRQRLTPAAGASDRLDYWREISQGLHDDEPPAPEDG